MQPWDPGQCYSHKEQQYIGVGVWVILCRIPEKRRKEIEEKVEEMKEREREERGTGIKVKKQKK